MQEASIYSLSPSFSSYSSSRFAEIAAKVSEEFHDQKEELGLDEPDFESVVEIEQTRISSISLVKTEENDEDDESSYNDDDEIEDEDEDFAFSILSRDVNVSPSPADEIFSDGQIKPIYPVFNRDLLFAGGEDGFAKLQDGSTFRLPLRKLFNEERNPDSSTSSEADDFETLPDGTYCVWTPKSAVRSPEMRKKSNSTGGSSKRWRFRDLLHRSNSDGKDTYVFITPTPKNKEKEKEKEKKFCVAEKPKRHSISTSSDEVPNAGKPKIKRFSGEGSASPHEAHYVRNRAMKESDRRKSFLPYRQDLVGFFYNVNGLNRTLRPF